MQPTTQVCDQTGWERLADAMAMQQSLSSKVLTVSQAAATMLASRGILA